jgi:uncharacterized protein YndB with AHSA1/START domain
VNDTTATRAARAQFSIQRTYAASLDEAWALWTTKAGIESWWGPEGFEVTVRAIDLRPGGELVYVMTAVRAAEIAFMKQAGMPLATEAKVTYTEVEPPRRLGYTTLTDFIPDVPAYEVGTLVELTPGPDGVRMVLTLDAMHDDVWTERAVMGWESELGKLDAVIARKAAS